MCHYKKLHAGKSRQCMLYMVSGSTTQKRNRHQIIANHVHKKFRHCEPDWIMHSDCSEHYCAIQQHLYRLRSGSVRGQRIQTCIRITTRSDVERNKRPGKKTHACTRGRMIIPDPGCRLPHENQNISEHVANA